MFHDVLYIMKHDVHEIIISNPSWPFYNGATQIEQNIAFNVMYLKTNVT